MTFFMSNSLNSQNETIYKIKENPEAIKVFFSDVRERKRENEKKNRESFIYLHWEIPVFLNNRRSMWATCHSTRLK